MKLSDRPPSLKKIKSDKRKAEIQRVLGIQPLSLSGLRDAIEAFEPDISPVVLRSTIYNMVCDGFLKKEGSNPKNPTYSLTNKTPSGEEGNPRLRGFPPPRRVSADRIENVAIMKALPLRKLPDISASGSSLDSF